MGIYKFNQVEHVEDILHKLFEAKRFEVRYYREIFRLGFGDVMTCLMILDALQIYEFRIGRLNYKWIEKKVVNLKNFMDEVD